MGERKRKRVLLVLPVYNEEQILYQNASRIARFVRKMEGFDWSILILDNGSTDSTREEARRLERRFPGLLSYRYIETKGRGNALRSVWAASSEDILCYMDIDLSTSLDNLKNLLEGVAEGNDICIGSRYLPGSRTERNPYRLLLSKTYNTLIRKVFGVALTDLQCGFKAISQKAKPAVARTKDNNWFFDTELLLLGRELALKIKEIPVKWTESPTSSVNFVGDILRYLKAIYRLKKERLKKKITARRR